MSEYIADRDERIKYISGFSGSAGVCLITHEIAYMWTDGRYWLAAGKELEEGWELKKSRQDADPTWFEWSKTNLKMGDFIGFDPFLFPKGSYDTRAKFFEEAKIELKPIDANLVDEVWGSIQPEWPSLAVSIHHEEFSGRSVTQNINEVMAKVEENKGEAILITTLDQV
jgi:Xaa-Pro aminopeptidase